MGAELCSGWWWLSDSFPEGVSGVVGGVLEGWLPDVGVRLLLYSVHKKVPIKELAIRRKKPEKNTSTINFR